MTGYQELISDPSYCGQIVCMTYPLIGNYGINRDDYESIEPAIKGLIVKEFAICHPISELKSLWTNCFKRKICQESQESIPED
jgi:carbamoyl-phosphate synthase small subunit